MMAKDEMTQVQKDAQKVVLDAEKALKAASDEARGGAEVDLAAAVSDLRRLEGFGAGS